MTNRLMHNKRLITKQVISNKDDSLSINVLNSIYTLDKQQFSISILYTLLTI